MAEKTGIPWCHATVNWWWGCAEVSPGCDNCYARELAAKLKGLGWGPKAPRLVVKSAVTLAQRLNRRAIREGQRLRVFTNSMSDFFDNQAPPGLREVAWEVIRRSTALDWLILTKRPQNIAAMLPPGWGSGWPHVWLGISAENQQEYERRWPALYKVPAALRWMSAEPLLEAIDLPALCMLPWPTWIVIGAESGKNRRDCGVAPIIQLAADCLSFNLIPYVKQDCALRPDQQGRIPDEWFIRRFPESPALRALPTVAP